MDNMKYHSAEMHSEDDGFAEQKKEKKKLSPAKRWVVIGICISLLGACIFTSFYGMFRKNAEKLRVSPIENSNTISFLFQHSYLLYRDLYNKVNNTELDFEQLYLPATEGNEWIYREDAENYLYEIPVQEEESGDKTENTTDTDELSSYDPEEAYNAFRNTAARLYEQTNNLENSFSQLNFYFDYLAEDLTTGEVLSNLTDTDISFDEQYFVLSFIFDENGNVSLGSPLKGNDPTAVRKYANEVMRGSDFENRLSPSSSELFQVEMPKNFSVTYCIAQNDWAQMQDDDFYIGDFRWDNIWNSYDAYHALGTHNLFCLIVLSVFALAILLPGKPVENTCQNKMWNFKTFTMPFEAVLILFTFLLSVAESVNLIEFVVSVAEGRFASSLNKVMPIAAANGLVYAGNILVIALGLFAVWYLGSCIRPIRELGIRRYFKKNCLLYRFFPFIKMKAMEFYEALSHFDVTRNAKKMIWKIIIINGVLLFIISSLWVGGLFVAVVYSVILYFILKKYISDIQKKYSMLLSYINQIAEGNLNVSMTDDLGVFNPFKPQLIRIQRGFKKAVEEEVKSSKMKSELITNVSHDLKTPLTAIITYVNLLKDENITEEQRKEYLDTLERKSLRLKVLIEDLFEVSKASTGNVTFHIDKVDVMNLVKQVALELSDKLEAARLDMRIHMTEEKVILPLDSQKTYRIYENLIGNIAKYALPGTRVYINGFRIDDTVVITLKNITAQEINISPEELTERFMRGDSSRNTEGSGLGLAIAKSFAELQGGKLEVEVDGDLFKVTTTWKLGQELHPEQ